MVARESEESIMKKRLALFLSGILAVAVLGGCGAAQTDSSASAQSTGTQSVSTVNESTNEAVQSTDNTDAEASRTSLTVGFDAEFPPYGYLDDNGEYVGFDLDLAQEVCVRRGWELIKQPIDWEAKDMELSSGAIDCIWNGFTMTGRESEYTWSEPYVDNSQVFVVASGAGIKTPADLAGKIVAVQKESSALAALNNEEAPDNIALRDSFQDLIEYADYNTAFMDLEQGAVDAVAMDIGVANYQISSRGAGEFVILDQKLASEQYAVGFLLGNTSLRDAVQETINEMAADGTFLTIAQKWGLEDSICIGK
jgi:polar amino acid transport system substrate-binding protein